MADLAAQLANARAMHEQVASQLEVRKARLRECDEEITALVRRRDELNKQVTDANVERKRLEHK